MNRPEKRPKDHEYRTARYASSLWSLGLDLLTLNRFLTPVIGDVGLKYVRQSDVLLGVQMQIWDDKKESSLSIVMSILFPLFM